jgi:hypothetical protein
MVEEDRPGLERLSGRRPANPLAIRPQPSVHGRAGRCLTYCSLCLPLCLSTFRSCPTFRQSRWNILTRHGSSLRGYSREDLEDLLADPNYFQAVFHSMRYVKDLYQSQAELGSANETLASIHYASSFRLRTADHSSSVDNNLKLRDDLYQTRQETQDAFNEAKALEMRWRDLDREQRELYQVGSYWRQLCCCSTINSVTALRSS